MRQDTRSLTTGQGGAGGVGSVYLCVAWTGLKRKAVAADASYAPE